MHHQLRQLRLIGVLLLLALAACQPSATGVGSSPSAGAASSNSAATPSETPLPLAVPRPTDIPTDGTCEEGHICLGLLTAGTAYQTKGFEPRISFSMPSAGWENLEDQAFVFGLLPINAPGDGIYFFRGAKAANADRSFATAEDTVGGLSDWLASNPLLAVTPAMPVTVGGLSGVTMEIRTAASAANHPSDCPVETCVPTLRGQDMTAHPPWHWDWESDGPEIQRLYLLTASDGVVAIFVDSLDGATFDALSTAADQILAVLKFG
jgi:hypothetical protein